MTFSKLLNPLKTALIFILVPCSFSLAQSENFQTLLTSRQYNIDHQIPLKSIDKELYQLGYRPKAIVKELTAGANQKKIEFSYFNPIVDEKKQRIIDRLKSTYSFLTDMEIDTSLETISVIFPSSYTKSQLEEIVLHFGYNGYEIY